MRKSTRMLSFLLALILCAALLPLGAVADDDIIDAGDDVLDVTDGGAADADTQDSDTEDVILEDASEPVTASYDADDDNDALFAAYVDQAFGIDANSGMAFSPLGDADVPQVAAYDSLSGIALNAYNLLVPMIREVANGTRPSAEFQLPLESLEAGLTGYFTASDLGVSAIVSNGYITQDAHNAMYAKFSFDTLLLYRALLADLPYDLYWHNKSSDGIFKISFPSYQAVYSNGQYRLHFTSDYLTISMLVASAYAASGTTDTYVVNSIPARVTAAVTNAQSIVTHYASLSDYNKLVAYKDEICSLTAYNDAAANNSSTPYGDPWQLIYVFDGDSTTNVVCEGYSKAFKYLCDQSDFNYEGFDCILATGYLGDRSGYGGHMWNIVTMDDGNHYLVDITNCDEDSVGYPDKLFLKGYYYKDNNGATLNTDSGTISVDVYYYISFGLYYCYDYDLADIFPAVGDYNPLDLCATDYAVPTETNDGSAYVYGHSLTLNGDIGINFYYTLTDTAARNAAVYLTHGDDRAQAELSSVPGYSGIYKATIYVAAKEMMDDITAELVINGKTVDSHSYSVRTYADLAFARSRQTSLQPLMYAMLNYGAYAQLYFKYNTEHLANEGLNLELKELDPESIAVNTFDQDALATALANTGVTYRGATLTLESTTTLSLYFIADNAQLLPDATPVETSDGETYYRLAVTDIAAKDLDNQFQFNVRGCEFAYGPFNYVKTVLQRDTTSVKLKNLVTALYWYNDAANTYFD